MLCPTCCTTLHPATSAPTRRALSECVCHTRRALGRSRRWGAVHRNYPSGLRANEDLQCAAAKPWPLVSGGKPTHVQYTRAYPTLGKPRVASAPHLSRDSFHQFHDCAARPCRGALCARRVLGSIRQHGCALPRFFYSCTCTLVASGPPQSSATCHLDSVAAGAELAQYQTRWLVISWRVVAGGAISST